MKFPFSRAAWRYVASAGISLLCCLHGAARAEPAAPAPEVRLSNGMVQGMRIRKNGTDLSVFRGIPFAAPPVGAFRWREPQPVARWAGTRKAHQFGPRCAQPARHNHTFRSTAMSEDCLYLNVWTPAHGDGEKLPVLVYFHGGGFLEGDGSEPRYDGAGLATRGIVTVTVNYRLGIFGFLAPPDAAQESPHGTAGNYGLLDQVAALRWVRENIAQFGGDPKQVTIGGESSGAISVAAHMASPLSRGLFARAIGQGGGAFVPMAPLSQAEAHKIALKFIGERSLAELRTIEAGTLLDATGDETHELRSWPSVDGHFLPAMPVASFSAGAQARVPLIVGTNTQEREFDATLQGIDLTPQNWPRTLRILLSSHADEALTFFPGSTEEEVARSVRQLQRNMFVNHCTWRWMDLHRQTGGAPVYFYEYAHPRPLETSPLRDGPPKSLIGTVHGAEIEYALDNLDAEPQYVWAADDREVSRVFSGYVAQFVKTGNPNGSGLPEWPAVREQQGGLTRQVIANPTQTVLDRGAAEQAFMLRYYDHWNPPGDS
jgi:para-nitrobenzyl esterase